MSTEGFSNEDTVLPVITIEQREPITRLQHKANQRQKCAWILMAVLFLLTGIGIGLAMGIPFRIASIIDEDNSADGIGNTDSIDGGDVDDDSWNTTHCSMVTT